MNVCIFGASSELIDKKYINGAYDLGAKLAKKGTGLFSAAAHAALWEQARAAFTITAATFWALPPNL